MKGIELRKASEAPFPYKHVSYIRVDADGSITFLNAPKSEKDIVKLSVMLEQSKTDGSKIIAPWPGKYKTDIFEIDDINAAIKEIEA